MPGAIGWAPALLPSRGGVIARRRFNPGTLIPRTCAPRLGDRGSGEVEEASLLPVVTTRVLRQARSPCEVQVLLPCQFFGHTRGSRCRTHRGNASTLKAKQNISERVKELQGAARLPKQQYSSADRSGVQDAGRQRE